MVGTVLCLENMRASRTPLAKIKYKHVTWTVNISVQKTCTWILASFYRIGGFGDMTYMP